MSTSQCQQSCQLFFKKKNVCVTDPCASIGLNCRAYGAGDGTYDCQEWCCEKDSGTLGIFVVVVLIVFMCCGFCCAFAVYRFILRKKKQALVNGVRDVEEPEELELDPPEEEVDIYHRKAVRGKKHHDDDDQHHDHPPKHRGKKAAKGDDDSVPNSARSSTFSTSSYGDPNKPHHKYRESSSSKSKRSTQGKSSSGEKGHDNGTSGEYAEDDDYYTSQQTSARTAEKPPHRPKTTQHEEGGYYDEYFDGSEEGDATKFLNESSEHPTDSRSQTHSHASHGKKRAAGDDDYFYDNDSAQPSARSTQSAQSRPAKGGVWEGEVASQHYDESPRSRQSHNSKRGTRAYTQDSARSSQRGDGDLFQFEDDF